jgi:hypothetical protein
MSNYVPYSDVYQPQNYDSGPIQTERQGVRYDPTEDIEETARRQQMEAWNIPGARRAPLSDRNLEHHRRNSRYARDRSADDAYDSRRRSRRYDDDDYSDYETYSDYEESNRQRRRSRRDDGDNYGRRTQSERRGPHKRQYDGDVKGLVEQHFDLSPDGALYAALGAGVGAIAARRFGGNHFDSKSGSQNWKTIAGAVIGGVGANAAEKAFQRKKFDKFQQRQQQDD